MKRPLSLLICLLVPFVLLVMGLFFGAVYGYREIPPLFEESGRGLANPKFDVHLPEAGKYTVWLSTYTVYEGTEYEAAELLPSGARVMAFDTETNKELPLSSWTSASKNLGRETSVSIGNFETLRPDTTVQILADGLREPLVLSVASTKVSKTFQVIFTLVAILVISLLLAIVSLIILLHRRQRQLQLQHDQI